MKKALLFAALLSVFTSLNAQTQIIQTAPNSNIRSLNPMMPSHATGVDIQLPAPQCMSEKQFIELNAEADRNVQEILRRDPAAFQKLGSLPPAFIWPTQPKAGFTDYGYYTVQFQVDQDMNYPNHLLDYNCGQRTYDFSSGNHQGTDIIYWPYPWRRMDDTIMVNRAAADGVIVLKRDGYPDHQCANNGNTDWNGIIIQHSDTSRSWYLHFKTGAITSKVVGDPVTAGEYLGNAGSSGSSDWPHLHFEVRNKFGGVLDPYQGACNSLNANSLWQNQPAYNIPSVNRICTKNHTLDFYQCPVPETTYERDTFNIGDTLGLFLYIRDRMLNSTVHINIYNPSNQNVINWDFTLPWADWPTSYLNWYYPVDGWWVQGWWKFEALYGGNTYQHMFYMTHSATGISQNEISKRISIFPNPARNECTISGISFQPGDELTLKDAAGRTVMNHTILNPVQSLTFKTDAAAFDNGMYFLSATTSQGAIIKKLIIQH